VPLERDHARDCLTWYRRAVPDLLDALADAWSGGDVETFVALFTDDCFYEDVPLGLSASGKEELRAFVTPLMAASPDFRLRLTSKVVAGDRGGTEWEMTGTHEGDLPGLPRTGKRFQVRGASALELAGDRIRRCTDYWDLAIFLRQLGFITD
jgi:steroid delta-isomerase-like uncharacterized protein